MAIIRNMLVIVNLLLSVFFLAIAMSVYQTRVDLVGQLKKAKTDVQTESSKARGAAEERDTAKKELAAQKEQTQRIEKDSSRTIADLKKNVEALSAQLNDTRKESSSSVAELSTATNETKQRKGEVAELRSIRDSLVQKNNELTAKNTKLQDDLAQVKNDLDLSKSRSDQLYNQLKDLQAYVTRFKGSLPDEAELRTGQDVPPPPTVEGIVTKVDKSGKYIQISLGEDDGIKKGQILEVWRTKPEPKYLGRIRIDLAEPSLAVAKPVAVTGLIQENDRVGARILTSGN